MAEPAAWNRRRPLAASRFSLAHVGLYSWQSCDRLCNRGKSSIARLAAVEFDRNTSSSQSTSARCGRWSKKGNQHHRKRLNREAPGSYTFYTAPNFRELHLEPLGAANRSRQSSDQSAGTRRGARRLSIVQILGLGRSSSSVIMYKAGKAR